MGKYSSDSENEKRGSKNSRKVETRIGKTGGVLDQKLALVLNSKCRIDNIRRSSSSDSSDSRSKRRSKKYSYRSISKDKYSKSRRSRSSSTSTYRSSKSKSHTSSKEKSRRDHRRSRSRSKTRYRSRRSRSRSYIREYVKKPKRSSSSSSSSSFSSGRSKKDTKIALSKPSSTSQNTKARKSSPDCVIIESEVLNEINEDKFTPKEFISKSKKVPENIVIDLEKNTIKVPEVERLEPDSIFHHNLFLNEEARMEKWIKELYSYRQKALQQGLKR